MKLETNRIICGDCLEVMKDWPDNCVDLVLTDPPYGMNNDVDSSRFSGGTLGHIAKRGNGGRFKQAIIGDDKPFDPTPFLSFEKVILWGANHYGQRLPVGTMLVWIKRFDAAFGTFLSDAEIGWMKGGCGVYCRRDLSLTQITRDRRHPNEKPLSLMEWCIQKSKSAGLILDPFCGSGTTCVAAKMLGRRYIGIDISEKYCDIARMRLEAVETGVPVAEQLAGQMPLFEGS